MGLDVVVIGAGIVGAASAIELLRDGHRVTIVEPGDPGGEQAASYGNGALLNPSSVIPVSLPGLWKKVPGYLMDPMGPLTIRWSYLPRLLPWLVRFVAAGATPARVRAVARALRPLVADAPARHRALADEAGAGALIQRIGVLHVFPTRAEYEAEALVWDIRRENGAAYVELDADDLYQREPALDRRYRFGLLNEAAGHCLDPGAYVAALVAHAQSLGATLVRAHATGFVISEGRLRAVRILAGDDGAGDGAGELPADRAVIAAGARSRQLAAEAGDRVFLETERGYHIVIEAPEVEVRHPIMPSDGKMAVTPTRAGLRIAGQVELAGLDAAPNWKRAEVLRAFALRMWPGLPRDLPAERMKLWMGHRPSTPDGVPCLGPGACPDIIHAYGHGHIGLVSGPASGRLVADFVSGKPPSVDPAPFSPRRFA